MRLPEAYARGASGWHAQSVLVPARTHCAAALGPRARQLHRHAGHYIHHTCKYLGRATQGTSRGSRRRGTLERKAFLF
jgi:hypothetical protein